LQLDINTLQLVDVGAYDGYTYSNFKNLIDQGASAILIEPCLITENCEPKFSKLKELSKQNPKIKSVNALVKVKNNELNNSSYNYLNQFHKKCEINDWNPERKTLDEILNNYKIKNYDILNIDIDSYDHVVWEEHTINPKIVIIEINSGLNPEQIGNTNGCSFLDSILLAKKKGYSCVCHTGNMFYVRDDLLNKLSIPEDEINTIKLFDRSWL
jgi:FkbM family methyltransferase